MKTSDTDTVEVEITVRVRRQGKSRPVGKATRKKVRARGFYAGAKARKDLALAVRDAVPALIERAIKGGD